VLAGTPFVRPAVVPQILAFAFKVAQLFFHVFDAGTKLRNFMLILEPLLAGACTASKITGGTLE
jgi:hypothetical protein